MMEPRTEEWLRQADYDMETADYMWAGGRYLYAVFMCHLSIEKALKGLFYERQRQFPPKSHNFVLLMSGIGIQPPDELGRYIVRLSEASIPTRYPEDLARVQKEFGAEVVAGILAKGKEVVAWIKSKL